MLLFKRRWKIKDTLISRQNILFGLFFVVFWREKGGVQDGDSLIAGGREFEWNGSLDNEAAQSPEHAGYKRRETKAERLAKRADRRKNK